MLAALLVAVIAAAGLAVFGLFGDPPPAPGVGPEAVDPTAAPLPQGPALESIDPAVGTRVVVRVTSEEQFLPPPESPVVVLHAGGGVPLPTTLLAGVGAQLRGPAQRGLCLVATDTGSGATLVRRVAVDPAAPAPHSLGLPAIVAGTVLDAAGKPIVGARIWLGERDAAGQLVEVQSDEEGRFSGAVASGSGVPIVVRAAGCASVADFVELPATGLDRQVVLTPATSLAVQLVGLGGAPGDARVFVTPLATVSTGLSAYPFFLQTLQGGWPVDGAGHVALDDLPADSEVGVVVVHPLAAVTAPRPVRLRERPEQLAVQMRYEAAVAGRVVDERGSPVAAARVLACADPDRLPSGPARRLLPALLEAQGAFVAAGDREGAFVVGAGAAAWRVEAPGHAGRIVVSAQDGPVVLPRWRGEPIEFVLSPPRAGEAWVGETDLGGGLRQQLPADGVFRVSLPHAGRFTFALQTFVDGVAKGQGRREHVDATGRIELTAPPPE